MADFKQSENGQVWKKNVSLSQVIRLQKREAERAEKTKPEDDEKRQDLRQDKPRTRN